MRIGILVSMTIATLTVLGTAPARAQLIAECRGDVQRFCAGIELGGERMARCLEDNVAKLSAGCKKAIGSAQAPAAGAEGGGVSTACRGDAMRLCPDAIGDQAKLQQCMQSHAAQLSDGCKTAIIAQGK
jgi:hypothetical protein